MDKCGTITPKIKKYIEQFKLNINVDKYKLIDKYEPLASEIPENIEYYQYDFQALNTLLEKPPVEKKCDEEEILSECSVYSDVSLGTDSEKCLLDDCYESDDSQLSECRFK